MSPLTDRDTGNAKDTGKDTGKVGPDHARAPARLAIFEAGADSHHLSQTPAEDGHRLFIAAPRRTAPAQGWPVIYLLDGNAAFDFLTPDHLAGVPGLVVVGVGYDTDRQFARERRTLDFTPPDGARGIRPDPVHPGRMAGGGADFLARLTGPLRARAEEGLPIDPARRTLWGHSFGGLFTLYAALSAPESFARFAAISPSVWWDADLMGRIAEAAAGPLPPLLIALSDAEKRSGQGGPPPAGPAPATMALIRALRENPGPAPQVHILPGLAHIQTLAASLPLALPFAAA